MLNSDAAFEIIEYFILDPADLYIISVLCGTGFELVFAAGAAILFDFHNHCAMRTMLLARPYLEMSESGFLNRY